jgi:hypothetical protein
MCSLANINIKQLSSVMDDYEEGKPLYLIAVTHDITKEDVQQIVRELSYFRKNRHKFVSDLSGKIVS